MTVWIDGGSKGNPGPASWGFHAEDGTEESHSGVDATNNEAEYFGLIAALQWAKANNKTSIWIKSDSMLLVQQMKGKYQVKAGNLKPLYATAKFLCKSVGAVTFEWIPREQNTKANKLANGKK